uniref:Uncharacterized protein n=1 Tax=Aegilops tauschii subsp. strangulata TaxID=200361 RepID=A0A453F6F2_AEGTS
CIGLVKRCFSIIDGKLAMEAHSLLILFLDWPLRGRPTHTSAGFRLLGDNETIMFICSQCLILIALDRYFNRKRCLQKGKNNNSLLIYFATIAPIRLSLNHVQS